LPLWLTEEGCRVMRVAGLAASVAAVLCLAVMCGTADGSAASSLPLTQRVLKAGEFAGLQPVGPPMEIRSAVAWAHEEQDNVSLLRKWGFVAGIAEQMFTPGNPDRGGLSVVVELSSAASAKAYLTADTTADGPWKHFTVPAIPDAIGFEQSAGDDGGRNIGFTLGPYVYVVGAGWQGGTKNAISVSSLRSAALRLYHRVKAA
jgi:hypothetical protein